jgi:hypothetical protein
MNVMVPVATKGVTIAVNVTELPLVDGFNEELSVTEEGDFPNSIPGKAMQPRATARARNIVRFTIRSPAARER